MILQDFYGILELEKSIVGDYLIGSLYIIRNDINNKVYIGKTYQTIEQRFKRHLADAKKDKHKHVKIYRAINKYGPEHFYIELIDKFEEGVLEQKEIEYIAKYDSYHNGYNSTLGGDGIRKLELDENAVIEAYKQKQSLNKVASIFKTTSESIKRILESHNIEIYIPEPIELSLIAYDKNYNRIAKLDSRQEVLNFLPTHCTKFDAWITRIIAAANNCTTFAGYLWQNQVDVLYGDKEFNTVYDKEQYIAGKECVKINGIWFVIKRCDLILDIKTGKLHIPEDCVKISINNEESLAYREELEKMVQTMTVGQIAKKYHTSYSNMRGKLITLGLQTDVMKNGQSSKCPSKEELEKVKNLPKTQIGKMYGVSDNAVKKWFVKYGITDGFKQKSLIPSRENLESLLHLPTSEVAKKYNVSCDRIRVWYEKYGLKSEYERKRQEIILKEPTKDELENLKEKTYREIGKMFGVSHKTIIKLFKKYGIEKQNRKT